MLGLAAAAHEVLARDASRRYGEDACGDGMPDGPTGGCRALSYSLSSRACDSALCEQCMALGPAATLGIRSMVSASAFQARFVEVAACMLGLEQAVELGLAHAFIPEGMSQLLQRRRSRSRLIWLQSACRRLEGIISALACALGRPVAEFFLAHFIVQLLQPGLQVFLHIGHGTVVDAGAYFREKEIQQGTGLHIAYGLVHVFAEIAFYGGNGLLPCVFGGVQYSSIKLSCKTSFASGV